VRQYAGDEGLPDEIIKKPPTAELWPGQSDEGELGLTYAMADRLLHYLVDKKFSDKRLLGLGFKRSFLQKVKRRIAENAFKRHLPPIAMIYPVRKSPIPNGA